MRIVVQKFGGTSVSTKQKRDKVAAKIINAKKSGFCPVVVVSAMGRDGEPYATDTLIKLATDIVSDTNRRELDLLVSCGEIISTVVMANTLKAKGYEAMALTGGQAGIITDDNFGNANILRIETKKLVSTLKEGKIPIVAGFQGVNQYGEITTLGRGGSDVTAAILGEALEANCVEIYTDVDGIMTADPNIVSNAQVLRNITYAEVFQIAEQGARVIHPKAVEIAMRSNLPLLIKNTNSNAPGTIIGSMATRELPGYKEEEVRAVTSIAHMPNRTQVTISCLKDSFDANNLLNQFAENGISIDLINIFPDKMIFTIDEKDTDKGKEILNVGGYTYNLVTGCSKISAVGNRMRGVPGVMAKIIKTLASNNIEVLQTADSHTTISCLIKEEDAVKAILALHEEFVLWKN